MRIAICCLLLGGCTFGGGAPELQFKNPPKAGVRVVTDNHDVRCESRAGARYTAETGFFHNDCSHLPNTGVVEWRVIEREYEDLGEGGVWLLRSRHDDGEQTWIVLPWHDWA